MKPLLSIVVPTKNRYKYLKHLIRLVESFNSSDLELVIQDNSDDNQEILQFISENTFTSLRYHHSSDKLSMAGNSNLAIQNSEGEYLCFIGDDDGVCRNIIDCVKWMKKEGVDAVKSVKVGYYWGDYNKEKLKEDLSQTLVYKEFNSTYTIADPIRELEKALEIGFQDRLNLPFLYNGIVKRSVLDKIYAIGKTYFPGGSPDISNGVGICFYLEKYAIVEAPVIISGTSQMTGGGIHKRKGKVSKLHEVGFIEQKVIDNWEKEIPKIWAGRLAWPESALKGIRYVGKDSMISKMNYEYMLANFSVYHHEYAKMGWEFSKNKLKYIYSIWWILTYNFFRVVKNKIVGIFVNRTNSLIRIDDVPNIMEAEEILMREYLKKPLFENSKL